MAQAGGDRISETLVLAALVFGGRGLQRRVRRLFLANGLGLPAAAVYVYTMDALHPLALAALAVWCLTFPAGMGLSTALFRSAGRAAIGAPAPVRTDENGRFAWK